MTEEQAREAARAKYHTEREHKIALPMMDIAFDYAWNAALEYANRYGVLRELMDEWAVNHAEHCSWDTPCRSQWCGWDLPKSLQNLPPEILDEWMQDCGRDAHIKP